MNKHLEELARLVRQPPKEPENFVMRIAGALETAPPPQPPLEAVKLAHKYIEPQEAKQGEFYYAINQALAGVTDPEHSYSLDEKGNFIPRKLPNDEKIIQSVYWQKQRKKVALIGLISSVAMFSILAQETDMLNVLFWSAINGAGWVFGQFVGAFI